MTTHFHHLFSSQWQTEIAAAPFPNIYDFSGAPHNTSPYRFPGKQKAREAAEASPTLHEGISTMHQLFQPILF